MLDKFWEVLKNRRGAVGVFLFAAAMVYLAVVGVLHTPLPIVILCFIVGAAGITLFDRYGE